MQPSKIILQFMKTLLNEKPVFEQDFINTIQRFCLDKKIKTKHLCVLIRLEYWILWPYAQELHNFQHGKCKICIVDDDLQAQNESINLISRSTVSIELDQIVTKDKQASEYAVNQQCKEDIVCNFTIGISDNFVEDVDVLVKALATNDIKTLKHLTQADIDYDQLSKCYMKLHFDNVRIEMPIRDHIQLLFTEYSYRPKKPLKTTHTALNFQKCINNLLQEIISIIKKGQWENVWLMYALHQLILIAPYHYKNDTVWQQYIYITRQWIDDALNNTNNFKSPITKKLAKYTVHLLQPNKSDETEILADLEETYNAFKDQHSLRRITNCLELVSNVNCRDLVDQLALLNAIQISGECVKKTKNLKTISSHTCVNLALVTDETLQELTNCRNDLSHCVSLPHIDISLLETIKHKLKNLCEYLQPKLDSLPEKAITERVRLRTHLRELGKQLRNAPTELKTRMEPMDLLKRILQDVSLQEFRKDHKLSAAVTTLVLCIFEAMATKDKLKENKFWILENFPTLLDRQLRNHLAHSGWFQLMPIDETAALYFCARMLQNSKFHDQIQKETAHPDDSDWYASYYARRRRLIMLETFWQEILTNQVAKVKLSVDKDSTLLYSRRFSDHKHALHFAAESGEAMVRLILNMEKTIGNLQLAKFTDRKGYTALHIAALTSNHNTIRALRLNCQNIEPRHQCLRECKTALHLAVDCRKTKVVRELLQFTNNDLRLRDSNGYQAIHRAVCLKDLEIVRMLVDSPIDEFLTETGKTCLYLAAQHGHVNIAEYLLKLGSDVHQSYNGLTPLHIAALNMHLPMIELLVNHGAHLNSSLSKPYVRTEDNKLNLMIKHIEKWLNQYKLTQVTNYIEHVRFWNALKEGNTVEVSKFISRDVINFCFCSRDDGNCALHFAVEGRNMDCLRHVIDKCNINARNFKNQTALHSAVLYENLEATKLFLQQDVALHIFDIDGFLAVHQAVKSDNVEIMNLLIEAHKTKSIDLRNKCKQSCLLIAVEYGHGNIVEELLKKNATGCINKISISNLLLSAAQNGHLNVAKVLLKYGADTNILGKGGDTPLHLAAGQDDLKMCTLLVNHGAYSEPINKVKHTPRDVAKMNCHSSIVSYLDSVKQDEVQKIFQKMQQHDLKYIKEYFRLKPKLLKVMRFENAKTLLHFAIESNSIEIVSFVFRQVPALQNVRDGKGQTILHTAATNQCGNECPKNCTKIILQFILQNCKSVKIDLPNSTGKTALQLAVCSRNKHAVNELLNKYKKTPSVYEFLTAMAAFDCSIMGLLLKRLEDVNKRLMSDGRTLLHLAAKIVCPHSRKVDMEVLCRCSQFMAFQYLINHEHVDVNAPTDYKLTPLHIAARIGNVRVVKILIDRGANVNALSDYGTAALTLAVRNNHTEVTRILVKERANVNESNWQNKTALYYALCNENLIIVRILIESGANMKKEYKDVKTSTEIQHYLEKKVQEISAQLLDFWEAIRNEKLEEVSSFLKSHLYACAAASSDTLQNALHIAAGSSSLKIFEFLSSQKLLQNSYHNKDQNGRTVLHIAIFAGKTDIVDYILNNCPLINVNDQDYDGLSAMHIAAVINQAQIVKMLLNKHANCNLSDQLGITPFFFAVNKGYTEVARLLLQHGVFDKNDYIPLHLAASTGNTVIIDLLLQYEADVDILGLDQETPLHLAAQKGHVDLVHFLCEHGSNVDARNFLGNTPMHMAAMNGHAIVVLTLYTAGAKVTALNAEDRTPLHMAAMNGQTNVVKLLLTHGVHMNTNDITNDRHSLNIDAYDVYKYTPLQIAAIKRHLEVVKVLIKHGAKIDTSDKNNYTPLHNAASQGHLDVVHLLLAQGAQTEVFNNDHFSPVYLAALNFHTEIIQVLNDYGADICARDMHDNTALHIAVVLGHSKMVNLLIRLRVDVDVRGMKQLTPLHLAANTGQDKIASILISFGADINARDDINCTPIHEAALNGHSQIVRRFLNEGASIYVRDENKNTPLHVAALHGKTKVVRILLQHSIIIDVRNELNLTPLHAAAMNGHTNVAKVLIKYGANIHARSIENCTLLHLAALHGHPGMVKFLIKHGAEINALTSDNNTPYQLAVIKKHTNVVNILSELGASLNINFNT